MATHPSLHGFSWICCVSQYYFSTPCWRHYAAIAKTKTPILQHVLHLLARNGHDKWSVIFTHQRQNSVYTLTHWPQPWPWPLRRCGPAASWAWFRSSPACWHFMCFDWKPAARTITSKWPVMLWVRFQTGGRFCCCLPRYWGVLQCSNVKIRKFAFFIFIFLFHIVWGESAAARSTAYTSRFQIVPKNPTKQKLKKKWKIKK